MTNEKTNYDLIKIIITTAEKTNSISLIHIRLTERNNYTAIKHKVEKILKRYDINSIENKYPDTYIYEKQLFYLSFLYKKLENNMIEIGSGLFSHVLSIYKTLKKEIFENDAFIYLTVYQKNKKIIGYSDKFELDKKIKKKINIVKDLSIIVN